MNKMIITTGTALVASLALATNYTWTGGGNDGGKWTTPQNWGVASGYPNDALDCATFNGSATVELNTGADTPFRLVTVTKGEVTLTGTEGSRLVCTKGYADGIVPGFAVQEGAVLNLGVPWSATQRADTYGNGTINFSSVITGSAQYYLRSKDAVFGAGASVEMAKYQPSFAMGNLNDKFFTVSFRDGAKVDVLDFCPTMGSVWTSGTLITQEGADTAITVNRNFRMTAQAEHCPVTFKMKEGTISVAENFFLTTTHELDNGQHSQFIQEGGTVTVGGDLYTYHGDYHLKGGTLALTGALLHGGYDDGAVYLSGGTLHFGKSTNAANARIVIDGTNGVIKLAKNCNWADLNISSMPNSNVRLEADSAVTVTFAKDAPLPAGLTIGANVKVYVPAGVSVVPDGNGTIPSLTINAGGVFACRTQSARVLVPLHLAINGSGQFKFDDGNWARTAVVAYSYTVDGVKQANGVVTASNAAGARIYAATGTSSLWIPYVWTGAAGDGDFDNTANWLGGQYITYSSHVPIDLSQATGEIAIPGAAGTHGYGGVSYLPTTAGATLRVVGKAEGSALHVALADAGKMYYPVMLCRKGCTLDFALTTKFTNTTQRDQGIVGGGTVRFSGPLEDLFALRFGPMLDTALQIGGTLNTATLCYNAPHDCVYSPYITFIEGANVTVSDYIACDGDGFVAAMGYDQYGGSVTAKLLAIASTRQENTKDGMSTLYRLYGGLLTVTDELRIGGRSPLRPNVGQYYKGAFVLNGGTATVAKVTHELNDNYIYILGGEFRLGAGGIVRSKTSPAYTMAQQNPPIRWGSGILCAKTASWSVDADFTTELQVAQDRYRSVLDVASGLTATFNGPMTSVGGLIKRGAGTAVMNGAWSATGKITVEEGLFELNGALTGVTRIDVNEGGALTLPATVPATLRVSVPSEEALTLNGDVTLEQLTVGGKVYTPGAYTFKGGTATVAFPEGTFVWIGANGGNWKDAANWEGNVVPDAETAGVDFSFSDLRTVSSITVDGAVSLKSLALARDLALAGEGSITFSPGGSLDVAEGTTLTCEAAIRICGAVQKRGAGKVKFAGLFRCADDIATLTFPNTNQFQTVAGETEIAGTLEGLRVEARSADSRIMPRITVSEGAVATNCCTIHGPYGGSYADGYGEVVIDGGLVNFDPGHALYGMSGTEVRNPVDKWAFCWTRTGETRFTVNGGSVTMPNVWLSATMNLNNTRDGGAKTTVTLNGGELIVPQQWYVGTQEGAQDMVVVNGGVLRVGHFCVGAGMACKGYRRMILNGGEYAVRAFEDTLGKSTVTNVANTAFEQIEVNGLVTFSQAAPDVTLRLQPTLVGNGTIRNAGAGVLTLVDFDETLGIELEACSKTALAFTGAKRVKTLLFGASGTRPDRLYGAGEEGVASKRRYFAGAGYLSPLQRTLPLGFGLILR